MKICNIICLLSFVDGNTVAWRRQYQRIEYFMSVWWLRGLTYVLFTCKESKICCCKQRGIFKYLWLSSFTVWIFCSTKRSFSNITRNEIICALTCTRYSINRYSTITAYLRMDVIKKNTYYLFYHFLYSFQMNFKCPPLSHSFS